MVSHSNTKNSTSINSSYISTNFVIKDDDKVSEDIMLYVTISTTRRWTGTYQWT